QIDRAGREQADMIEVQRIGKGQSPRACQRVIGPDDDDKAISSVRIALQGARGNVPRTDADFRNPLLDTAYDLGAGTLLQIEPHKFGRSKEPGQSVGEEFDKR